MRRAYATASCVGIMRSLMHGRTDGRTHVDHLPTAEEISLTSYVRRASNFAAAVGVVGK